MTYSIPLPAKLHSIVKDLFQNESVKTDSMKKYYTFSNLKLTEDQLAQLVYPSGFTPINVYFLQQTDSQVGDISNIYMSMVSFVQKEDGFIYGYYFDITDQPRIDRKCLIETKHRIVLDTNAKFTPAKLLEAYNDVLGKTMILSISTDGTPYATLQYSHSGKYYYELLTSNGILDPQFPVTKNIGLSENLTRYCRH